MATQVKIYIKLKRGVHFLLALLRPRKFQDIEIEYKLINPNRRLKNIKFGNYDHLVVGGLDDLDGVKLDPEQIWIVGERSDKYGYIPYPMSAMGVKNSLIQGIDKISAKKYYNRRAKVEQLFEILPKQIDEKLTPLTKEEIFERLKLDETELGTLISMLIRYLRVDKYNQWRLIKRTYKKQKAYKLESRS